MFKAIFGVVLLLAVSLTFSGSDRSGVASQSGYEEPVVHKTSGITFCPDSTVDSPDLYRAAKRFAFAPHGQRDFLGFRVAMKAHAL